MPHEPYRCQSCSTVLVLDGPEPHTNASCPLCLSRVRVIEEIEETWQGFVCRRCNRPFSIQANRSPYRCPICTSSALAPAPEHEPHLFGTKRIQAGHATAIRTKLPSVKQTPWQPVPSQKETWKDWLQGVFLLATDEIGIFVFLAAIISVIGILYMLIRFLLRIISHIF